MYIYSMTQWIAGDETIESSLKRLKECGYNGIELAADPHAVDQKEVVELLKKYNLSCTSLCGMYPRERDFSSTISEVTQNAIQYIKDNVDYARRVGAPYIILVPSAVGGVLPAGTTYEAAWNNAVTNVRRVADYAWERGVRLAIEPINRYETFLVNTIKQAVEFVKDIDHKAVGLMADLFHMSIEERNIGEALREAGKHLLHVHIADNTREAAGMGSTDFKEALYVLKDIGYEGPLTMEFLPRVSNPYMASNMETKSALMDIYAKQAIGYMKALENSINV